MIVRIDDIGASTKKYNQHGKKLFRLGKFPIFYFPLSNFLFFKKLWPFRGWANYDEITAEEWKKFLKIFEENGIVPIIAITACWVDRKNSLTPFPEKFPEEARILKKARKENKIRIANHGLTHCIPGKHMPLLFKSNRQYHREFLPYLDQKIHTEHILKSQKILEDFFEIPIELFVPPGNMWSKKTYLTLKKTNIKKVVSGQYMLDSNEKMEGIEFVCDHKFFNLHDRELKLFGSKWLERKIKFYSEKNNHETY